MSARNEHELWLAYEQHGTEAAQSRDEAMTLAKLLRGHAAYADRKDARHGIVTRDIKALYDTHVPNEPAGDVLHVNGRAISGLGDPQLKPATATPPAQLVQRWNARAPLESFTASERIALRQMLLRQPGYRDQAHPDHAAMVADAKSLYAMDAGEGV
ncbi:hypothetical protein [Roseateles puraquae]|uniref:Uncharacterized protein n=1 Tax=Roseateles puraquae TaxID=431059 RepID=A0A254N2J7_9BURK|nr:hypothetical protein [Roseateles puraquae]MDG0856373.1 hypothetical protein [Roseateles puraquae]OWR02399.1 hypothetical protein CDO81_19615 [Roseateles puraquae]